jgi:hypothetical protein
MNDQTTDGRRRPLRVFLSHSSQDREIAEEIKALFGDVFDGQVAVDFSSDQASGGGIPPGEQWLPWITERIEHADLVLILLTPGSIDKPWILWESGAAAGIALARGRATPVVPVVFGLPEASVPGPLRHQQLVQGDGEGANGIDRLLRSVNERLDRSLTDQVLQMVQVQRLPEFLVRIARAVDASTPAGALLASVPSGFSATALEGHWITCYRFRSTQGEEPRCHADMARIHAVSERRIRCQNFPPEPRTEGRAVAFRNEVDAELVGNHLIGTWRNLSDRRYFGSVHLDVQPGETVMDGHYTAVASNSKVTAGSWRWVRLDASSMAGTDLATATLLEPRALGEVVAAHTKYDRPLPLRAVLEGARASTD